MTAYYNENDPKAAAWLRELIKQGAIAPGDVDERSIADVVAGELAGYAQCHFFAGIGGWSYALRLAGWSDDRPVWTGSCPCQPFSQAGRGLGTADERHLWPVWRNLIAECRPSTVFGEQVASPAAIAWLAIVQDDMEGFDYAFAPFDLPAAGAGAPHIRQRVYFVADDDGRGREARRQGSATLGYGQAVAADSSTRELADTNDGNAGAEGQQRSRQHGQQSQDGGVVQLGDTNDARSQRRSERWDSTGERVAGPSSVASFWSDAEWIPCRDGKWRPVEPGTFPLANGFPCRVGLLRGYGNAISPEIAAQFISAYREVIGT